MLIHSTKTTMLLLSPLTALTLTTIFIFFLAANSKQFYDGSVCSSGRSSPGSSYSCNNSLACDTFIVYRARTGFETVLDISILFGVEQQKLLILNHLTDPTEKLENDRDIIIPILCSCSATGNFFQSITTYTAPANATFTQISCENYESLVKLPRLVRENHINATVLTVPISCACPDQNDTRDGFQYLLTYPIVEYDTVPVVAERFGIPPSDIWEQNSLDPFSTIDPNTTMLIPLRSSPTINSSIRDPKSQPPPFFPLSPTLESSSGTKYKNINVIGSAAAAGALLILVVMFGFGYRKSAFRTASVSVSISAPSTPLSILSPDILAEMSKYSLTSYTTKEITEATDGFSEGAMLGGAAYKGSLAGVEVVVKQMSYCDARRTISIHSKINHGSIVRLEGICYGDDELSPSYLLFEFATRGCLHDCLANDQLDLPWHRRVRLALDVAVGLHYIHHCTLPSYIHMNVNSRNVLVSKDWRAKIANLGVGSVISSSERSDSVVTAQGWIAPEYLQRGQVSAKVDVFAFGVLLLELLSAREAKDVSFASSNLGFLSVAGSGNGCFSELREFIDPRLVNYPIADTLCMTVLARACVEDDPLHRPSMDDILKILVRMER